MPPKKLSDAAQGLIDAADELMDCFQKEQIIIQIKSIFETNTDSANRARSWKILFQQVITAILIVHKLLDCPHIQRNLLEEKYNDFLNNLAVANKALNIKPRLKLSEENYSGYDIIFDNRADSFYQYSVATRILDFTILEANLLEIFPIDPKTLASHVKIKKLDEFIAKICDTYYHLRTLLSSFDAQLLMVDTTKLNVDLPLSAQAYTFFDEFVLQQDYTTYLKEDLIIKKRGEFFTLNPPFILPVLDAIYLMKDYLINELFVYQCAIVCLRPFIEDQPFETIPDHVLRLLEVNVSSQADIEELFSNDAQNDKTELNRQRNLIREYFDYSYFCITLSNVSSYDVADAVEEVQTVFSDIKYVVDNVFYIINCLRENKPIYQHADIAAAIDKASTEVVVEDSLEDINFMTKVILSSMQAAPARFRSEEKKDEKKEEAKQIVEKNYNEFLAVFDVLNSRSADFTRTHLLLTENPAIKLVAHKSKKNSCNYHNKQHTEIIRIANDYKISADNFKEAGNATKYSMKQMQQIIANTTALITRMTTCVKDINEVFQALTESLKPKLVQPKMKRRSSEQKPPRSKARYVKVTPRLPADPLPIARSESVPGNPHEAVEQFAGVKPEMDESLIQESAVTFVAAPQLVNVILSASEDGVEISIVAAQSTIVVEEVFAEIAVENTEEVLSETSAEEKQGDVEVSIAASQSTVEEKVKAEEVSTEMTVEEKEVEVIAEITVEEKSEVLAEETAEDKQEEVLAETSAQEKQDLDFQPATIFADRVAEKATALSVTIPINTQPDIEITPEKEKPAAPDFISETVEEIVETEEQKAIKQELDAYFDDIRAKIKPSSPIPPGLDFVIRPGVEIALTPEQIAFKMSAQNDVEMSHPIENIKLVPMTWFGHTDILFFSMPKKPERTTRIKTDLSANAPAFYPKGL